MPPTQPTAWRCRNCGSLITDPTQAYVVWRRTATGEATGFEIIHQNTCDMPEQYAASMPLSELMGPDGLTYLLSWVSGGLMQTRSGASVPNDRRVADLDEFVDLVRRIHVPGYDLARRAMQDPANWDRYQGGVALGYTTEECEALAKDDPTQTS